MLFAIVVGEVRVFIGLFGKGGNGMAGGGDGKETALTLDLRTAEGVLVAGGFPETEFERSSWSASRGSSDARWRRRVASASWACRELR